MATNHGSHDGGTDATQGTGALNSAPGNQPSDSAAPPTPRRGGQVHPDVAAVKSLLAGLVASALAATGSRATTPVTDESTVSAMGVTGAEPSVPAINEPASLTPGVADSGSAPVDTAAPPRDTAPVLDLA
ncbi:MAG: hypothetical protein ACTMIK_04180, partial [Galactobacter sp.]